MRAQALKEESERAGPLMRLLLRYTQALITQIAQTAACNRHYLLDQRLCDGTAGDRTADTHRCVR